MDFRWPQIASPSPKDDLSSRNSRTASLLYIRPRASRTIGCCRGRCSEEGGCDSGQKRVSRRKRVATHLGQSTELPLGSSDVLAVRHLRLCLVLDEVTSVLSSRLR